MGISRDCVKLLIQEALRRPFEGRILTLGKQDVFIHETELKKIADEFQFNLFPCKEIDPLAHKLNARKNGFISDKFLLSSLGFSEVRSLDYSNYENADYLFDLNQPQPLLHLVDSFDFILDGGTLEHVFHLPNALTNIFEMVRTNGRIFHVAPSSNHIDHGFYMFSPTLFWDFYHANNFDINRFQLLRHKPSKAAPTTVYSYKSGCLNNVSYGGLDNAMYAIHCVVTKTSQSSSDAIFQQFDYQHHLWRIDNDSQVKTDQTLVNNVKDKIKKNPFMYKILLSFVSFFRARKRLKIKPFARY